MDWENIKIQKLRKISENNYKKLIFLDKENATSCNPFWDEFETFCDKKISVVSLISRLLLWVSSLSSDPEMQRYTARGAHTTKHKNNIRRPFMFNSNHKNPLIPKGLEHANS